MLIESALTNRFELFVASGALAAHASSGDAGFRQRDVRFFAELFSNWAEVSSFDVLPLQNTQVSRYLDGLVKEGFVRRAQKGGHPLFRLTRVGLLELINRLVTTERTYPREYFFFLIFFIDGYRSRLDALVRKEGAQFPPSLRVELESLLDVETLIEREVQRTNRDLMKLQVRIDDARAVSELARRRRGEGASVSELVAEVESTFPYELNSRKPLRELIGSIAIDQRVWEFEEGTKLRRLIIWERQQKMLNGYLVELRSLLLKRKAI